MILQRVVPIIAAGLFCAACIPWSAPVTVENPDNETQTRFGGVLSELDCRPAVDLLIIHGMGTHDSTYADGFLDALEHGGELEKVSGPTPVDDVQTPYGSHSTVHRRMYRNARDHELRVYVLTWSKLTEQFEDDVLAYDWEDYSRGRVLINRGIKHDLIDTSFDDAVAFSGTYREAMIGAVERAFCIVVNERTEPREICVEPSVRSDVPIFLLTHSLGSAMAMSALEEMYAEDGPRALLAEAFVSRFRGLYMFANQLPLLYLAKIPIKPVPKVEDPLKNIHTLGYLLHKTLPAKLPIVAFSDANDLLTYPIPPGWGQRVVPAAADKLYFINIAVTNAPNRWFGIVVNPGRAHTGYWTNGNAVEFVAEGNPPERSEHPCN